MPNGETPQERSTHARMAAHALHSQYDSRELTRAARAASPASLTYFERQVDPEGTLDPGERARRAEHARKAHFQRLNLKSQQSRRTARSLKIAAARSTGRGTEPPQPENVSTASADADLAAGTPARRAS